MNLPTLNVPALLKQHGIRPNKSLGQNYLVEERTLKKIVQAAQLTQDDIVLEIGAGLGNLTRYLAVSCGRVIAIEIDPFLQPILRTVLEPFHNVAVVNGDILKTDINELLPVSMKPRNYKVVANIPYYITSAVIRHLLEADPQPSSFFLTIQREVAERICAKPGQLSLLALSVQVYGNPEIVFHIPAGSFYPSPKVESSLVKVAILTQPRIPREYLENFFLLAKAGFSQKRKKIRNALASGLGWSNENINELLSSASIDTARRAQTLTLDEWKTISEIYSQIWTKTD